MIENYLLEELVTFAECGTLSKTADNLMITQPTITRGLQKLESEFGVPLFNRQPNRLTLTKAGQMAAEGAKKLLDDNQKLVDRVKNYAESQRMIWIGGTAPGPLIVANHLDIPHLVVASETGNFILVNDVTSLLENHEDTLILSHEEVQTNDVESIYIGKERLDVNIDQFTLLANHQSVKFSDLKDMSFIVLSDIGPWRQIIQDQIPGAKFLYQGEMAALQEITRYSNFPYFSTNVTELSNHKRIDDDDRTRVVISDEAAQMEFYAVYLKKDRRLVTPIVKALTKLWPK